MSERKLREPQTARSQGKEEREARGRVGRLGREEGRGKRGRMMGECRRGGEGAPGSALSRS